MTGRQAKLAVLGVFLAGVVTGAAGARLVQLRTEAAILKSPDPLQQIVLYKMTRDLDLTPEQRSQVHEALRAARRDVMEASRDVVPRFLEIWDATVLRIGGSLDAEQRARFEEVARSRRKVLEGGQKR